MSIYLKTDTTQKVVDEIANEVRGLSSVKEVTIKSPEDARNEFIRDSKDDPDTLDATKEAKNKFFWTVSIKVQDINDTSQLAALVESNELVKENLDPNHAPSFAGTRRDSIQKIASAGDFAQKIGIVASVVFASISMLIIFNTIRMAIFNRREEIQMMKLIGAERSFIRGPFLVEAIVYGFFAAIIATALGVTLLMLAAPSLEGSGLSATGTSEMVTYYAGFVLIGMIILGAIIGVISSLLATRRYLKL
jgi:cell division transport system permease protein